MNYLDRLQRSFTTLINRHTNLPIFAPAFFFGELVCEKADDVFMPMSEPAPFDTCWMIYESNNPPFGTITNIVLIQGREARLWTIVHGLNAPLRHAVTFDLDDPSNFQASRFVSPRAVMETTPEIRLAIQRINDNHRETTVHPSLGRLNAKRMKGQQKKIAPYIVIKNTRRVIENVAIDRSAGTGSPRCPHNRRGHWRHLRRSGKRVWVSDCAIHGGRDGTPRDYRFAGDGL